MCVFLRDGLKLTFVGHREAPTLPLTTAKVLRYGQVKNFIKSRSLAIQEYNSATSLLVKSMYAGFNRINFSFFKIEIFPSYFFIDTHTFICFFSRRYIVTFSQHVDPRAEEPQSVIIWDVRSGQKKRSFNAERPPLWPIFKWSSDDRYFARIGEDMLSVYETPVSVFYLWDILYGCFWYWAPPSCLPL